MLDTITKRRIDSCRDMLVGKVPDPKSQVEQITIALIYKFMDDMDAEAEELGGQRSFFAGEYAKYGWANLMSPRLGGQEVLNLYQEALATMPRNDGIPALFRDIFKNAYLPYRDPETLRSFLREINGFTYDHSERLGDAFEYLLSVLGSQGDAGQFRTPRHIIDFIVSVVDPKKDEIILDPACGTAGFLISSYKHILAANLPPPPTAEERGQLKTIRDAHTHPPLTADERARLAKNLIGYDISPDMVRLSLVNLYLHGFAEPRIEEYDTLTSDDRWNEHADVILANPPFMSPKGGIKPHKRFSVQSSRSEVLFVDYIAEHLTPNGRAGVIVPEGIIFQSGGAYKDLRKMLVTKHLVAVVSLPAGVFQPYSGVKTSILILDRKLAKASGSVLFVKIASDGFGLGAQRRAVALDDLPEAKRLLAAWMESLRGGAAFEAGGAANVQVVAKAKIAESGDYNLSGDRYTIQGVHTSDYEVVKISDVSEVNPRKSEVADLPPDTLVSFVPMQDVNENRINFTPKETRPLGEVLEKGYTYFRDGDVLLAKVTPCFENGKAAVAGGLLNGMGFGSSEFYVLRASDRILPELLYYFVSSARFKALATPKMTGTGGLQRVPRTAVADYTIPLPPLTVQQEIVAEIAGYQKIIDGARQVVESYKPRIDVRPEWPTLRVEELAAREANSIKAGPFGSSLKKEVYVANGYKIYGQEQVIKGDASFGDYYIDEAKYRELYSCRIQSGDVLISLVGTFGKALIVPEHHEPGIINPRLMKITLNAKILPQFFVLMFRSFCVDQIQGMTHGGTMEILNVRSLKQLTIPVPDLETQRAIVAEIEVEQRLVHGNKELAERFEVKIKAAIGRVWGDLTPPQAATLP